MVWFFPKYLHIQNLLFTNEAGFGALKHNANNTFWRTPYLNIFIAKCINKDIRF